MDSQIAVKDGETEAEEASSCQHQWMIDAPNGPSSHGACRLCGEEKEFLNYIEGSSWGYEVSIEQIAGTTRLPTKDNSDAEPALAEDA